MAKSPASHSWNDIQMVIATLAMTFTVGLWNVFADQDMAKEAAIEPNPSPASEMPAIVGSPTPLPPVKIMLGGAAPQVQVIRRPGSRNNGGGEGGSVATTRSS